MKKVITVAGFILVGAFLFTSCKKDWTCNCQNGENYPIKKKTKRDAESVCEGKSQVGIVSVGGYTGCYLQED